MERFALFVSAVLLSLTANAAPVVNVLSWIAPTQNTDGSALAASSLVRYEIFAAKAVIPDNPTTAPNATPSGTATTANVTLDAVPGETLQFRIRACSAVCGPLSAAVTKLVPSYPVPNPPTGPTITVTISLP